MNAAVNTEHDAAVSVLVPTRNRARLLPHVLQSLDAARAAAGLEVEIVVVDNGSTDDTATVLTEWAAQGRGRSWLHVAKPGRACALNQGLPHAHAPLLAFTDDDVDIPPSWIHAIATFFREHPEYDGGMGRVHIPPAVTDPEVIERARRFHGTLPLFDAGDAVREVREMFGCNMAVRRHVFERVGLYDERLGVGASGLCEDTELSARMRRAGMRIGYMPAAVIYHTVDPSRLTPAYFRDFHLRLAQSRALFEPPEPLVRSAGRWFDAAVSFLWWGLRRDARRRTRAWGRMIRHRETLRLRWRTE